LTTRVASDLEAARVLKQQCYDANERRDELWQRMHKGESTPDVEVEHAEVQEEAAIAEKLTVARVGTADEDADLSIAEALVTTLRGAQALARAVAQANGLPGARHVQDLRLRLRHRRARWLRRWHRTHVLADDAALSTLAANLAFPLYEPLRLHRRIPRPGEPPAVGDERESDGALARAPDSASGGNQDGTEGTHGAEEEEEEDGDEEVEGLVCLPLSLEEALVEGADGNGQEEDGASAADTLRSAPWLALAELPPTATVTVPTDKEQEEAIELDELVVIRRMLAVGVDEASAWLARHIERDARDAVARVVSLARWAPPPAAFFRVGTGAADLPGRVLGLGLARAPLPWLQRAGGRALRGSLAARRALPPGLALLAGEVVLWVVDSVADAASAVGGVALVTNYALRWIPYREIGRAHV
jgi:hypothetical protein